MFKVFFEDLEIGHREEFGSYDVTREEVIEFASKYDPQPFHLNDEAAKKSVFGGLCASGWHTGSMLMAMMVKHFTEQGLAVMGSPGLDQIRWKKPVMVGDTIRASTELLELSESKSRPTLGFIKSSYEVYNQKGEVVMTMIGNAMVMRRPKD